MSLGVIVAFIVGVVVGLLVAWFYFRQQIEECQARVRSLRASLDEKERGLENLRSRAQQAENKISELEAALETEEQVSFAPPAPEVKPDNLARIEGIGPKISQVLQEAGIKTFAELADAEVGRLEQILRGADLPFANPSTWPEQARLAADGKWEALDKLQDELKGGQRA